MRSRRARDTLPAAMRVATYNLWNSPVNWERRLAAIVDELRVLSADVVALQEAPTEAAPGRSLTAYFEAETGYREVRHVPYPEDEADDDRPEGLALLSRHSLGPVWTSWADGAATHNSFAVKVDVEIGGASVGFTNVHLDWESPDHRLQAITELVSWGERHPADIEILCGDFNDPEDGPVAAYLEAGPGRGAAVPPETRMWQDAVVYSVGRTAAPMTLDPLRNPRWAGSVVSERPARFDRIYLRSSSSRSAPRVVASGLFGREPANRLGIVPSDHYGVFVDLEL
jgi:maltose 6'-phosphate phosphatase